MLFRLLTVTVILMALGTHGHAYTLIGTPPTGYTLEAGTYSPYKSVGGAIRYLEIVETSVCKPEFQLVAPSTTFTIPQGGTFKQYRNASGAIKRLPAVFIEECEMPESEEPNVPPPQTVDFTGLSRISINPTPTDKNDCTFLEWKVTSKNIDGTYMLQIIRWFDASQMINGARTCPYK